MSPALQLVVACCRWPDDERRRGAIVAAALAVGEWDEVVRLAARHRVEPLVVNGLMSVSVAVPAALAASVERFAATSLRDIAETLRIAAALDQARIEHRFLKGAALGVAAFGSPLLKRSWDIDLLVAPSHAVATAACLAALGYSSVMPPRPLDELEFDRWQRVSKEAELRSPRGSTVELHWRASDHPALLPHVGAHSPERRVALLGGHEVATFADDLNLAYLAVHGTCHAWFRLKWLADFNAFLQNIAPADRPGALARAGAFGVGRALDAALILSNYLFGNDQRQRTGSADRIARSCRAALAEPDEEIASTFALPIRWHVAPGIAYRSQELAIRARGVLDRIDYPLPRRWQFLYPILRVPFWIARSACRRRIEKRP
ncbi:MAG: nucleotidyltransferase family protein [Sphingomicrobium sp.]